MTDPARYSGSISPINPGEDVLLDLAGYWVPFPFEDNRKDWFMDIHREFFSRISGIASSSSPMRIIRYSFSGKTGLSGIYLGIILEEYSSVPRGMTRWILTSHKHIVISPDTGTWRSRQAIYPKTITPGEIPILWRHDNPEEEGVLTASAWMDPDDHERDQVVLVPYDPAWPVFASACIAWFSQQMGNDFVKRAEHYGSTAVPGMIAKPVIDLLIEVPSLKETLERIITLMDDTSREFWLSDDHITLIIRDPQTRIRRYHIHLAPAGHTIWQGLAFRDHLRKDPETASAYARLKEDLSARFRVDREEYTKAKGDLIREVLSRI